MTSTGMNHFLYDTWAELRWHLNKNTRQIIKWVLEERYWLIPGSEWLIGIMCFVPVYYIQIGAQLDVSPSFCCRVLFSSFDIRDNGNNGMKTASRLQGTSGLTLATRYTFRVIFTVVFIYNDKNVASCKWMKTHPALLGFVYNTTGQNTSLRYTWLKQELKPHWLTTSTCDAQKHALVTANVEQLLRDQKQSSTTLTCWNKTKPIPIDSL